MKEYGYVIVSDPENGVIERTTLCCCHCGRHWVPRPGSGRIRGFCTKCMGPVCGPGCVECTPRLKEFEAMLKGIPVAKMPVVVPFNDLQVGD